MNIGVVNNSILIAGTPIPSHTRDGLVIFQQQTQMWRCQEDGLNPRSVTLYYYYIITHDNTRGMVRAFLKRRHLESLLPKYQDLCWVLCLALLNFSMLPILWWARQDIQVCYRFCFPEFFSNECWSSRPCAGAIWSFAFVHMTFTNLLPLDQMVT